MTHREMDGFTGVLVELLKIGQAQPANIELTQRGLANGEAGNTQVILPVPLQ
jgi:hypothetical protein